VYTQMCLLKKNSEFYPRENITQKIKRGKGNTEERTEDSLAALYFIGSILWPQMTTIHFNNMATEFCFAYVQHETNLVLKDECF
jgi:hypothetical protein